jgi:dsDNA-binding SOS-regulon protein
VLHFTFEAAKLINTRQGDSIKIKRIASYQTNDGQTFTDKKDAQAHQKTLDRRAEMQSLIRDAFQLQDAAFLDG